MYVCMYACNKYQITCSVCIVCVYICTVFVCIVLNVYVCMHVHICNQKLFQLSLYITSIFLFLSRITQLEQCVSSPFVFFYRKMERMDQALIEIDNFECLLQ